MGIKSAPHDADLASTYQNGSSPTPMTRVWRYFSPTDKILITKSFQTATAHTDCGCQLIINLVHDRYDLFKILLSPPKDVKITNASILRKEYPHAAHIGDATIKFIGEVINEINNPEIPPGEIIKKCRVLGAFHHRRRISFQAENWLSIKRVLVDLVLEGNNLAKREEKPSRFSRSRSLPFWPSSRSASAHDRLKCLWQRFTEVVIKNMKSGYLDAAAYGPESVENEKILEHIEIPVMR